MDAENFMWSEQISSHLKSVRGQQMQNPGIPILLRKFNQFNGKDSVNIYDIRRADQEDDIRPITPPIMIASTPTGSLAIATDVHENVQQHREQTEPEPSTSDLVTNYNVGVRKRKINNFYDNFNTSDLTETSQIQIQMIATVHPAKRPPHRRRNIKAKWRTKRHGGGCTITPTFCVGTVSCPSWTILNSLIFIIWSYV